jgi:hypothetical protein
MATTSEKRRAEIDSYSAREFALAQESAFAVLIHVLCTQAATGRGRCS